MLIADDQGKCNLTASIRLTVCRVFRELHMINEKKRLFAYYRLTSLSTFLKAAQTRKESFYSKIWIDTTLSGFFPIAVAQKKFSLKN